MKPTKNRGIASNVVVLSIMDENEEKGTERLEDGPMTRRCVYVQDRDSQRWSARALADTVEMEALCSAE